MTTGHDILRTLFEERSRLEYLRIEQGRSRSGVHREVDHDLKEIRIKISELLATIGQIRQAGEA